MTGPKRVTDKQLAANRANALRSTGPRTPAGKAAVRYNALSHGILASAVIPEALEPYESREAFDALHATLCAEFSPANAVERLLVEQIAIAYWRLARLYRSEAGAIAKARDDVPRDRALASLMRDSQDSIMDGEPLNDSLLLQSLKKALPNADRLRRSMLELDPSCAAVPDAAIRAAAEQEIARLEGVIRDRRAASDAHDLSVHTAIHSMPALDTALKYARYETALQGQLDRALNRLERLQRLRGGEFVAPPIELDVSSGHLDDRHD